MESLRTRRAITFAVLSLAAVTLLVLNTGMGAVTIHARSGTIRRADSEAVENAMSATGVAALSHRSFPELSVGEQALVMIARVLAQDTPVLLLDEPTASLDIRHQHRVMEVIRHRARQGVVVLAVLHDLNLAARYADRMGIMAGGRLRTFGQPGEVLLPALLSEVYDYPIEVLDHPSRNGRLVTTSDAGGET